MGDPSAVADMRLKEAKGRLLLDGATAEDMQIIRDHLARTNEGKKTTPRRRRSARPDVGIDAVPDMGFLTGR